MQIEVVPELTDDQRREVLAFWAQHDPNAQEELLGLIVCLLRGDDGALAGFSGVVPAEVGIVGGRALWVYGSVVEPGAGRHAGPALFKLTHQALEQGFAPGHEGPLGLCQLLADPLERRLRRTAEWADPRTFYVGYLPDGRQVRVAWFAGAQIQPGGKPIADDAPLAPNHTVARFDPAEADEVVALWTAEGALSDEEARRRVGEAIGVARVDGVLGGVCTAYVDRNEQLGLDLWHYRVFVAREHRRAGFAHHLARFILDELQGRWERGEDRRAAGVVYELQNQGLQGAFTNAIWGTLDMVFVGVNARGDHLRVRYFPGANAPEPPPRLPEPQPST